MGARYHAGGPHQQNTGLFLRGKTHLCLSKPGS